ncbi:MAG: RNA methyltransferase, partial [Acidimicrobiaceae bacterium]|nr:RNA methyltransferase [Acidimicrobiaceae bacterium]
IVLGSEPHGLDNETGVDEWCRIDMPGRTESLNVAMAGTLLLYQAVR